MGRPCRRRQARWCTARSTVTLRRSRRRRWAAASSSTTRRSEEHTSELQSPCNLVCRLLLEKKNNNRSKRIKALRNIAFRIPELGMASRYQLAAEKFRHHVPMCSLCRRNIDSTHDVLDEVYH